jgi:outer membrane protein OmpA-like peptidoglycan-associated protein
LKTLKIILSIAPLLFVAIPTGVAQKLNTASQVRAQQGGQNPIYKITINVVERKATAINYRHRSGATKIDFRGTPLMPATHGEAKVESKQGCIEIEVEFRELQSATRFGPEFLTYVMWAITPEGRATNLGEIILNGTSSKLNVTTELQAFGLIVTAEPYFAVAQPSDVVVMENFARRDTVGKVEEIDVKYELLKRGQYTIHVQPAHLQQMTLDKKTPLDLYEARNAVRIAKWAGADVSAAENFQKASKLLEQAENYQASKAEFKPIVTAAREAVQTAEDARRAAREKEAAVAESAQARKTAAAQSEREKQELRNKLVEQLNLILETRDTPRGLIVQISDVLFDTGKDTLRPVAREKLAKISGIVLAHPSLRLEVEGHTDSVGSDDSNMKLSETRANSVRDFLVHQGTNTSSIAARGFGKSQPVATNNTAAGRQRNRRVELIVSGDVIGIPGERTSEVIASQRQSSVAIQDTVTAIAEICGQDLNSL